MFADQFDMATHLEQMHAEESLKNARALAAPETHPDFDGATCVECGDRIQEGRLKLGKVRCVYCQQDLEAKRK